MNNDHVIVSLPYPVKIMGLTLYIKRKIGFNFTNRLMYCFRELHNIKVGSDFDKWVEKNGQPKLIEQSLYCAALAYCEAEKRKQNFTEAGLIKALSTADSETQDKIMNCWKLSQEFGAKIKKKTSKVTRKM